MSNREMSEWSTEQGWKTCRRIRATLTVLTRVATNKHHAAPLTNGVASKTRVTIYLTDHA